MKSIIYIAICCLFLFSSQIISQEIDSDFIEITLRTDKLEWKQNEDIKIFIKITNLTNSEILLNNAKFDFQVIDIKNNISPIFGKTYFYSPVNLEKGKTTKLKFKKQDGLKVGVFETQQLKLKKNESKEFDINLSNLKWDGNLSSFYPEKDFYKIVEKGSYNLVFSIGCENCTSINSNELNVSVK